MIGVMDRGHLPWIGAALFSAALAGLSFYLLLRMGQGPAAGADPARAAEGYVRAIYARDYGAAYGFLSSRDRRLKGKGTYAEEQGPFRGGALASARRLAGWIQMNPVETEVTGDRAYVTLRGKLPDANAPALLALVQDWDQEKLDRLTGAERRAFLEKLEELRKIGAIPMIDWEEQLTLVKEGGDWRILLGQAGGVRVVFRAVAEDSLPLETRLVPKEIVAHRGDLFQVAFRVKNLSNRQVFARIAHRVEPGDRAQYLDLVQCGLLFPVRLQPGEEREYSSEYLVSNALPEAVEQFNVTYEFKKDEN